MLSYVGFLKILMRFVLDRQGNIAVIMALTLPVVLGGAGLGIEVTNWLMTQRSMQNAADAAAIEPQP